MEEETNIDQIEILEFLIVINKTKICDTWFKTKPFRSLGSPPSFCSQPIFSQP